jgi:hypothetical protein
MGGQQGRVTLHFLDWGSGIGFRPPLFGGDDKARQVFFGRILGHFLEIIRRW